MVSFSNKRYSSIKLHSVNIGDNTVNIPVADIKGNKEGKTLLVTAGVDGDEYASIEAAYALIDHFKDHEFAGRLIVIPILNTSGFFEEISFNPLDKKFPKFVYPGKKDGSPTERLIHWLHTTYVIDSDVWLDLHGGSLTEIINPFLWIHQTKNIQVDILTNRIIHSTTDTFAVCIDARRFGKAATLAKHNISYIIAESGHLGERKEESIGRHVSWAKTTMAVLGMTLEKLKEKKKTIYRKIRLYNAKKEGLWYPGISVKSYIRKGMTLGEIYSMEYQRVEKLQEKEDGKVLWMKEGMAARKGDVLVAVGYNEK